MPAAAPPSPRPVKPPPLVVGLTLSSTTSTGKGPRFGVGNTLMGTPASVAATPEANPTAHTAFDPRVKSANRSFTKTRSAATLRAGSSPQYPASAKRDGIEGVVVLLITIGKQGRVLSAQVLKGLLPALDESAIQAAKQTLWTPAMADGKPTQSTRRFNVRFRLQG